MPIDSREVGAESPLGRLRLRHSLTSIVSTESGILAEFPLPEEFTHAAIDYDGIGAAEALQMQSSTVRRATDHGSCRPGSDIDATLKAAAPVAAHAPQSRSISTASDLATHGAPDAGPSVDDKDSCREPAALSSAAKEAPRNASDALHDADCSTGPLVSPRLVPPPLSPAVQPGSLRYQLRPVPQSPQNLWDDAHYRAYPQPLQHHQILPFIPPSESLHVVSQAQRRHERYGHSYGGSGCPETTLSPPKPVRSHSVSRSWDAGGQFVFPLPSFSPLNTPQEHIIAGAQALSVGYNDVAEQHLIAAVSEPWCSQIARLLIELGCLEGWLYADHARLPPLNLMAVDAKELRSVTAPVSGRVIEALNNFGARLSAQQVDAMAVRAYEIAGSLGSKDGLLSAAKIYMKGGRTVRKDAARAAKLVSRADKL